MNAVQMDLFEKNDEIGILRQENYLIKDQLNNLRRGLFARFAQLELNFIKQNEELDQLKRRLMDKTISENK